MSRENVELVQRALEQYAATGEPDYALLDQTVEVHDHDILDAGEYRGHEGVARWLMDWSSAWRETVFEPQEFIDVDDRVVVVGAQRVTRGAVLRSSDRMRLSGRCGEARLCGSTITTVGSKPSTPQGCGNSGL